MNTLFKRKKTPEQLVKLLKEALDNPKSNGETKLSNEASTEDEVTKRLNQMKVVLYGEADQDSNLPKCLNLAELLIESNLILRVLTNLQDLPFEARKHVAQIFNNLMRRDLGKFALYVERTPMFLRLLIEGYESADVALNCGTMLREAIRHESLARQFLHSNDLWKFFENYVHVPNFDIASDAFATLKELLTRHKALTAEFFDSHFDQVFSKYNSLLQSENYVTRRQSLKLLGEILLDRTNFNIMMRYISKRENLKMLMNLLRDKSANIQFEAFHVFKVFVANPKKPQEITQILVTNKEKLILFLQNFQNEKEDEQFMEEKALLIKTLSNLESKTTPSPSPSPPVPSSSTSNSIPPPS